MSGVIIDGYKARSLISYTLGTSAFCARFEQGEIINQFKIHPKAMRRAYIAAKNMNIGDLL